MEQHKKECILGAAARLFARFGFKKASIDEIAKQAGVAKGTVYLAAETKEDLFYQAVHREVRAWTGELSRLIDPRTPAEELLQQCAQAGMAYLHQKPLVRELLFGSYHMMRPEWRERLDQLRELGRSNLLEILRLGVKQGRFRDDLDLEEVAKIVQDVMIATYLFYDRGMDRDERLQKRIGVAFEMLMGGMRARRKHAEHAA